MYRGIYWANIDLCSPRLNLEAMFEPDSTLGGEQIAGMELFSRTGVIK